MINGKKQASCSLPKSLFECAISRVYADSAVSGLSLEQALACKTGCPLLTRSLWARFRQPRRQSFFGQAIGIPHSNRLSVIGPAWLCPSRGERQHLTTDRRQADVAGSIGLTVELIR